MRIETIGDAVLYLGDCLEILPTLDKVDAVVTSPPYDNLRSYEQDDFVWDDTMWKKCLQGVYSSLNDGGVCVWVVNDATIDGGKSCSSFRQALYWVEYCGKNSRLHDTMIWTKDGGGAIGSSKTYVQNTEYMFILSKGSPKTVNRIKDVINKSAGKNKSGIGRRRIDGTHRVETRGACDNFKVRNNYWYIPPERGDHPAVFPMKLASDHIFSWSNTNDTILDPFMGSGTTGVACANLGRKFIGIEIEEKYFDISCERIEAAQAQGRLFE